MELLETQDPDKKKLIETSDRHKRELEREVDGFRDKAERMVTNALVIGGSLALAYFVISRFSGSTSKKKKGKDKDLSPDGEEETAPSRSLISQIGEKVVHQATLILLDMAREKLNEYLQSRQGPNENS